MVIARPVYPVYLAHSLRGRFSEPHPYPYRLSGRILPCHYPYAALEFASEIQQERCRRVPSAHHTADIGSPEDGLAVGVSTIASTTMFVVALLVSEGVGIALCLEGIVNTSGDSDLVFVPFEPELRVGMSLVWKKNSVQGRAQRLFLD